MRMKHTVGGQTLALAILLILAAAPAHAGTLSYTYDDAGRLTQVSGAPVGSRTYQLDAAGNRTGLSLGLLGMSLLGDSSSMVASTEGITESGAAPPLLRAPSPSSSGVTRQR